MTMSKYRVCSGDYEVVVTEASVRAAAGLAIRLHNIRHCDSELGAFISVELWNSGKYEEPFLLFTKKVLTDEQLFNYKEKDTGELEEDDD